MSDWSDGYVTDVQYTSGFYRELAPSYLAFTCLLRGVQPPQCGPGARYLELGCGQGFSTNLLAAANPEMDFLGVDFMPGQIANARRLATEAGLRNVSFEDYSFEHMAQIAPDRLEPFDFIVLHGILSWISDENRGHIVRILDRFLKPGGVAYVSYNCLPGWAPLAPIQHYLREYSLRFPGQPVEQAAKGLADAKVLAAGGGAFFAQNPHVRKRIEAVELQNPSYLVHEYLHAHWRAFHHADLARELNAARLDFVGSATLAENFVELSVPDNLIEKVRSAGDAAWRETLLDYAGFKHFRRDIYVRGASPLVPPARKRMLDATRFALTAPAAEVGLRFKTPMGDVDGIESLYRPIVGLLSEASATFREIVQLPALAGATAAAMEQAVALLVGAQQVAPLDGGARDEGPAQRFNAVVAGRIEDGETLGYLASPRTGNGVRVSTADLLGHVALLRGVSDLETVVEFSGLVLERAGRRLMKDGKALEAGAETESELRQQLHRYFEQRAKLYRGLGVLPEANVLNL